MRRVALPEGLRTFVRSTARSEGVSSCPCNTARCVRWGQTHQQWQQAELFLAVSHPARARYHATAATTPAGRRFFHVTGAFAEFERGMIRDRVVAGLQRAKAQGGSLAGSKVPADTEAAIRTRLAVGTGILKVMSASLAH